MQPIDRSMRPSWLISLLAIALSLSAISARGQSFPQRLPSPEFGPHAPAFESYPATVHAQPSPWANPAVGPALAPANHQLPPESLPAPAVTEFGSVHVVDTDANDLMRLGPTVRVFEPKARVFFDTGWEAPDKLDLFHDGALSASINFLEIYWQHRWASHTPWSNLPLGHEDWRWGPAIGIGISPQAGDSSDGSQQASGAPVLMLSAGLQFDFPLTSARNGSLKGLPTAGLEVGYALGVSSDESLDYIADGAVYVGVAIHVLP